MATVVVLAGEMVPLAPDVAVRVNEVGALYEKIAVTVLLELIVTDAGLVVSDRAPDQPVNL